MNLRRCLAALALACTALATFPLYAQSAVSHEVRRGDTLFAIASKTKHDGVSRNQMILAIWRANQSAFPGGNINLLEVGVILSIPSRDVAAAIGSAEADRSVGEMLAKAAVGPMAATKPTVAVVPAKPAAAPSLGRDEAARRYREGQALEQKGDEQGAFRAYLESGEAGNGLAQRRLGQIYDKGNTAVQRDYQASLKWYQRAREQGVDIDKPLPRMTTR